MSIVPLSAFSEDNRYTTSLTLAHIGWWTTVLIVGLRALNVIPQSFGTMALLTLGMGVTASLSLSRMRLARTITDVFQAGLTTSLTTSVTLSANIFTDTCIMSLNENGQIASVDHADAVGWEAEELVGRELRTVLSPRSMGVRKIEPGLSITSPMFNQDGRVFDARISVASLDGGDRLIATVSPVVNNDVAN